MKSFFPFLLILPIVACSSTQTKTSVSDLPNRVPGFKNISENEFKSIVNKDTLKFNDIYFEHTYASFKTAEAMYINFGMWDEVIRPPQAQQPMLIWDDVPLFRNDSITYKVVTSGGETNTMVYSSFMVFDQLNQDMLTEKNSVFKNKIVNWMKNEINAIEEGDFYHKYHKMLNSNYEPARLRVKLIKN